MLFDGCGGDAAARSYIDTVSSLIALAVVGRMAPRVNREGFVHGSNGASLSSVGCVVLGHCEEHVHRASLAEVAHNMVPAAGKLRLSITTTRLWESRLISSHLISSHLISSSDCACSLTTTCGDRLIALQCRVVVEVSLPIVPTMLHGTA